MTKLTYQLLLTMSRFVLALVFACLGAGKEFPTDTQERHNATGRVNNFSIFKLGFLNVFRFENKECETNSSAYPQGVCYTRYQCRKMGGEAMSLCSPGYWVCCVFQRSCGEVLENSNVYFVNPEYPSPLEDPITCVASVKPLSQHIVQLRVEFEMLELMQPFKGNCVNDNLTITVNQVTQQVVTICGRNSGQHLYIHMRNNTPHNITIQTSANSTFHRKWRIRVRQLTNRSSMLAPTRCLQYFPSETGVVSSFNNNGSRGQLINQLCYGICFPVTGDSCGIQLKKEFFDIGVRSYGPVVITSCSGKAAHETIGFRLNYSLTRCSDPEQLNKELDV